MIANFRNAAGLDSATSPAAIGPLSDVLDPGVVSGSWADRLLRRLRAFCTEQHRRGYYLRFRDRAEVKLTQTESISPSRGKGLRCRR